MADSIARAIADQALALRASHRHAPPLDVLDLVMKRRAGRHIDFGELGDPPHPFALLIAEAFDAAMTPEEWAGMLGPNADPGQRRALLRAWNVHVWDRFALRFDIA